MNGLSQRNEVGSEWACYMFEPGLYYEGIGNEIGVEMALSEANKLNYAAAVAAVKAVKDEEEARLKAEQEEQNKALLDEAAAAAAAAAGLTSPTEGVEQLEPTQSPDETKGMLDNISMFNRIVIGACYFWVLP